MVWLTIKMGEFVLQKVSFQKSNIKLKISFGCWSVVTGKHQKRNSVGGGWGAGGQKIDIPFTGGPRIFLICQPIHLQIFCRKLLENERIWTRGAHLWRPLWIGQIFFWPHLPGSATEHQVRHEFNGKMKGNWNIRSNKQKKLMLSWNPYLIVLKIPFVWRTNKWKSVDN